MARLTAADRYQARKTRQAQTLRQRTIESANTGARHARLRAKYGPDWQNRITRLWERQWAEWEAVVELNPYRRPSNPGRSNP